MKKSTKFASVVLAAAMVMSSLTACGGNGGNDGNADATAFKIGGIGPITGDAAVYGQAVMNGMQIAIDEINAAGGINGYQIEYKFQDDEHDAEKSVNAYNALKDWGVQMVVGSTTSDPCIAVAAMSSQDNIFQLTPSGSAVECVEPANVFRVCFSDPNQGKASAQYIGQNSVASKVAVIYDSSTTYSAGIYESFVAEAANQPFEVVAAEAFTADSATDFSVQLQKAKDAGAELVFLPIYYKAAAAILTQAASLGFDPIFFGCDGLDGLLTVEGFDTELAEGVMLLTPFAADATDDLTVKFVATYQEKYNDIPNQFAADAYDAVYALKAALEKADAKPSMSNSDLCEALKAAMVQITVDGLTGAGMTWEESGEPNKAPKAVIIKDGAYSAL